MTQIQGYNPASICGVFEDEIHGKCIRFRADDTGRIYAIPVEEITLTLMPESGPILPHPWPGAPSDGVA